ncbi:MAG TPA: DUF3040 domain-containing protein [Microbacteriaceae bacterium]|nr:DUF3040 domain-containing protein [Microbacteriaceae bacterium]
MPLSDHEQRLLDEMERNLYRGDGRFAANMSGKGKRPAYRSVVLGVLAIALGVAVLVTGVFLQVTIVGVIGFAIMFGGVMLTIAPGRGRSGPAGEAGGHRPPPRATTPGFMNRMNDRWDRRQHGDGL